MSTRKKPEDLRSFRWFGTTDIRSFGHRSRTLQMGYAHEEFMGKPVIGIINTWSDVNPCHTHLRDRADAVKRGVWAAGGFPVEIPVMSVSEQYQKPTTMLYRNFLAMETEESIRSHPLDGVVLLGGCDKSTPAMVMGATSAGLPFIFVPAGPMLRGNWAGKVLGSGADVWKYWAEKEAGNITEGQWKDMENGIARSYGTCMVMGTAATMMSHAEVLGLTLPGASAIPAADSAHPRMAAMSGKRIVDMVWDDLTPDKILTRKSFENALIVHMAVAGSTNAIIHLIAMAGRAGVPLTPADFDEFSHKVPVIANLRPSGAFLMEDFFYAGGLPALLKQLESKLHTDAMTVSGKPLSHTIGLAQVYNDDVIRPLDRPVSSENGLAVLKGNLAPGGCVIKPSAAEPRLLKHTGPALVFETYDEMSAAVNDENLDVTPDHVMVLKNSGPVGGPGMPEWGMLPIPKKLLKQGVRDMLRVSDARMSGTSYGACVLHVAPESYVRGPFAALKTGDLITVDVEKRSISVNLTDAQIAERIAAWTPPDRDYPRGYGKMSAAHIRQADQGCDFDFLEGTAKIKEPEIH
ncbi:dihydroxy-acid dehydratase [Phreatobacter aquaticus]|uniref:Dihydroxy-acid dehydratase n=1 Tax=Phreatobacter aquaticus TaxID=2570229 RepID=A0A4D7QGJ1_9HYPH|nr:L-arabinonate dehydratase [Phreatobacter aquaticus]QCK84576.1 dihydroxy-acid dehydratase [Phreatobacter aquaticus]